MFELAYILLATFIISLISFVGVVTLALKDAILNKILLVLIGLSAGALMSGIIVFFVSSYIENVVMFILPFAAGGFIYISATDLVPEIRKELDMTKYMATLFVFICGILMMWVTKVVFGG